MPTVLGALLSFSSVTDAAEFSLNIADIAAPDFTARGIALILPENGSADLRIAELLVRQRSLRNLHIRCADFALSTAGMSCHGGSSTLLPGVLLDFDYRFDTGNWQASAALRNVPVRQFAIFLPADMPQPTQGELNGALRIGGGASGMTSVAAEVQLADAGFSDASGLHAAENLRGAIRFAAARKAALWTWQGDIAWQSGEVFWQPLYLSGGSCDTLLMELPAIRLGEPTTLAKSLVVAQPADCGSNCQAPPDGTTSHSTRPSKDDSQVAGYPAPDGSTAPCRGGYQLRASGSLEDDRLKVEQATIDLPEAGRVRLAALWDIRQGALAECAAHGENLALEKLFADYARPFLEKSTLAEASLYGYADVDWQYRGGTTQALRLVLRDAGIADAERRFALLGVNSAIDWQADTPRTAEIAFAGGALLGVPLGSGRWKVEMRGMEFGVTQGVLPVLDGSLELRDFRLLRKDAAWHWQFAAALSRISMEQFSQAAGWPKMLGTLAGSIPRISYDGNAINVDGALLFSVFDGSVAATRLELADPFGRAPRLSGNLSMRELDLDLLTRTFSFGSMQGRIDVDVNGLELQDWQPARFDARLSSSAGNYPRKISQKAVQNISALGGAGAAAAIQRSYLRFFENFGYERIGWSCRLRNGVCAMGGVDDGNGGAYAIVKGGGIPAITVMGYNREVSWGELITRLKRVTQGNMQAVVK